MATPDLRRSRHPLQYFPGLDQGNHRITSPASDEYNCLAWAAGVDDRQVWPTGAEGLADEPVVTWPPGIPNDETVGAFVAYF